MNQKFLDFMTIWQDKKIAVAISGGVDSVCLICWLAALNVDVVALHVNHGLRDAADTETKYVQELANKLKIPVEIFYWTGPKPTSNLESVARETRYRMMIEYCQQNNINYLATAHQADDQIETFLMNLSRGSGVYGLAAMRPVTERNGITIIRPLLHVFRSELKQYCDDNKIKYFSDEMNDDEKYTRVRIRKNRYVMSEKLGISDERLMLAIDNLSRTRDALTVYINKKISLVRKKEYARFSESFLFDEPIDIRLKLLGTLVQQIGGTEYGPRLNSLETALDRLGTNCKITLSGCVLRRLGDDILIVPEGTSSSLRKRK